MPQFIYKLFICKRALNIRTNLGNKYLVNIYIIVVNKKKLNITWLTKKKGISCGIFLVNFVLYNLLVHNGI